MLLKICPCTARKHWRAQAYDACAKTPESSATFSHFGQAPVAVHCAYDPR